MGPHLEPPSGQTVTVTVVVPSFNCAALLEKQLAALGAQRYDGPWDVIVADNGSTDGTSEVVRRSSDQALAVTLLDASLRRGPAAARNAGARAATGALLLFTDADDEVTAGWIDRCVAGMSDADVGVGWLDYTTLNGLPPRPAQDPSPRQFGYLAAGLGANLAVRRDAFLAMDGFDEQLTVGEDIDFCWRAQLEGLRLVALPDAVVRKRERGSEAQRRRQAFAYGRGDPLLYRRFRGHGMPTAWWLTVKTWAWLLLTLPAIVRRDRRDHWLRVLWLRAGRLRGSLEQRVLYP